MLVGFVGGVAERIRLAGNRVPALDGEREKLQKWLGKG